MNRDVTLLHEFVEYIPDTIAEGTIYISLKYSTAVHRCCCGCGCEVVTPLSPTDWNLTFDGRTVSLDPSIGNWSFPCQSHYWIKQNKVRWAPRWSRGQIEAGRIGDRSAKVDFYEKSSESSDQSPTRPTAQQQPRVRDNWWSRVKKWWNG